MTPSWYDLLGVAPDASAEEIRAAWKAAIADLDPTDRRFRLLNQAAEVLLDPSQRAEYDATLAPPLVEPPLVEPSVVEPVETSAGSTETVAPTAGPPVSRPTGRGVAGWVLVALAVVTAGMVALGAWLATEPSNAAVAEATSEAQGAAERAVVTILGYDYRSLDEDQAAAHALMTSDYRKTYDQFIDGVVKPNAEETKTVVTVEVIASAIVRSGDDRVQVLVFMNRPTKNAEQEVIYKDQARITMEKVGDDWLVDGIDTN